MNPSGWVIRVLAANAPTALDGVHVDFDKGETYLYDCDFEAAGGRSIATFSDRADAKTFPTMREALQYLKTVPPSRPVRDDGQPNRPLRAFTVEFVPKEAP